MSQQCAYISQVPIVVSVLNCLRLQLMLVFKAQLITEIKENSAVYWQILEVVKVL